MSKIARMLLVGLGMVVGAGVLSACSINVNDDKDDGRYARPRTATDHCRREVERTYGDRYRIAYELPDLVTNGTVQTVTQGFTLVLRRENFDAPERRSIRCTVDSGVLIQVVPG